MAKLSKKVTVDIYKHVEKVVPGITKNTTYDEAWDILSQAWEFEGDLTHTVKDKTVFTLYRDGLTVETYKLGDMWDEKVGDFNYTDIFRTVLENIIKRRLYKRAKLGKKAQKEYDEKVAKAKKEVKVAEEVSTEPVVIKIESEPTIDELRKKRDNISVKIYDWKKKGKDVTELETELASVKEQLQKRTKTKQISNQTEKVTKCTPEKKNSVKSKKNK